MKKYTHEKAHEEVDRIFKVLLPQRSMAERPPCFPQESNLFYNIFVIYL